MNRILLIGNGFDLAHKLNTRYSDFINDFWENKKIKAINNEIEIDEFPYKFKYEDEAILIKSILSLSELPAGKSFNWFYENMDFEFFKKSDVYRKEIAELFNVVPESNYTIILKNVFLEIISKENYINWVDIECEYFKELKMCSEDNEIKKLNDDFDYIKTNLINYLKKQDNEVFIPLKSINNLIDNIILENATTNASYHSANYKTVFLCFNYTKTAKYYSNILMSANNQDVQCIYIHGELEDIEYNPIIFGYDDEMDNEFIQVKNNPDNAFSENIKTINYRKTSNYDKLLEFINKYEYHVYIMGHSCGFSDRTILSKIINTDKCKGIQIFYHSKNGKNDHKDLCIRLNRITRNIHKILPEEKCEPLSDIKKIFQIQNYDAYE
jgi:hypothetical protein